jgi:hypothetical protein
MGAQSSFIHKHPHFSHSDPTMTAKEAKESLSDSELRVIINDLFDCFDIDHDEFLDYAEVRSLVEHSFRVKGRAAESIDEATKRFMERADYDHDGKIGKEELYRFYTEN